MKTLNQYELGGVSGGNPWAVGLGIAASALTIIQVGGSFVSGFARGWNS